MKIVKCRKKNKMRRKQLRESRYDENNKMSCEFVGECRDFERKYREMEVFRVTTVLKAFGNVRGREKSR